MGKFTYMGQRIRSSEIREGIMSLYVSWTQQSVKSGCPPSTQSLSRHEAENAVVLDLSDSLRQCQEAQVTVFQ